MTERCVCFSHGKESGPWGTKIKALAAVARQHGWQVESLDYRGMEDPFDRVAYLRDWRAATDVPHVLVGSSMGGHVAAACAAEDPPLGLFLMAPAFYMPGYEQYTPAPPDCPTVIVHGRHDEVIPWEHSARYAAAGKAKTVFVDSDHRLTDVVHKIEQELAVFLDALT